MYLKRLLFKTFWRDYSMFHNWREITQWALRSSSSAGLLQGVVTGSSAFKQSSEFWHWGAKLDLDCVFSRQLISFDADVIWLLQDWLYSFFSEIYIAWFYSFLLPCYIFCSVSHFPQCLLQLHPSIGIHTRPKFIIGVHTVLFIFWKVLKAL